MKWTELVETIAAVGVTQINGLHGPVDVPHYPGERAALRVANSVRKERLRLHLTLRDVAKHFDVSPVVVGELERARSQRLRKGMLASFVSELARVQPSVPYREPSDEERRRLASLRDLRLHGPSPIGVTDV